MSAPVGRPDVWSLHPSLDVPDLRPCAVPCAIFEHDLVDGLRDRALRLGELLRADGRGPGGSEADFLESVWDLAFREVSGEQVFLLKDYGAKPGVRTVDEKGREVWTVRTEAMGMMSNSPEGRKWLASRVIRRDEERYCWCVSFEARRGSMATVKLDRTNWLRLGVDLRI